MHVIGYVPAGLAAVAVVVQFAVPETTEAFSVPAKPVIL